MRGIVSGTMKRKNVQWIVLLGTVFAVGTFAQEPKPADVEKADLIPAVSASDAPAKVEELERKFIAALHQAELKGRWCSIKDGQLGPEQEDRYTILGVSKLGGDLWLIRARIRYAQKDITAPIPVQVKWAGDTPVIIVDKIPVPGSGTYSARVMIFEQTYAGTWTGGDHGGLLSGVITHEQGSAGAGTAVKESGSP